MKAKKIGRIAKLGMIGTALTGFGGYTPYGPAPGCFCNDLLQWMAIVNNYQQDEETRENIDDLQQGQNEQDDSINELYGQNQEQQNQLDNQNGQIETIGAQVDELESTVDDLEGRLTPTPSPTEVPMPTPTPTAIPTPTPTVTPLPVTPYELLRSPFRPIYDDAPSGEIVLPNGYFLADSSGIELADYGKFEFPRLINGFTRIFHGGRAYFERSPTSNPESNIPTIDLKVENSDSENLSVRAIPAGNTIYEGRATEGNLSVDIYSMPFSIEADGIITPGRDINIFLREFINWRETPEQTARITIYSKQ